MPLDGDSLPETEQISKLGSGYSGWIVYQQGPHSSGEGLLPAGPEAEITFCCAEAAGAGSRLRHSTMPPSVPLGTGSVLGRLRWGKAVLLLQGGTKQPQSHFCRGCTSRSL